MNYRSVLSVLFTFDAFPSSFSSSSTKLFAFLPITEHRAQPLIHSRAVEKRNDTSEDAINTRERDEMLNMLISRINKCN